MPGGFNLPPIGGFGDLVGGTFSTAPTVTGVSPTAAKSSAGTAITLTGTEFITDGAGTPPVVYFGSDLATSVVVVDRQTITCNAPVTAQQGIVDITVITRGGTGYLRGVFNFFVGTMTSVDPPNGVIAGGYTVTLKGFNFSAGSTFTFGGVAATSVVFFDSETYQMTVPAHGKGYVDIIMTESGGAQAILKGGFKYTLFTVEEAFRRMPGIVINDALNNAPNTANITVDGDANVPILGEEIQVIDAQDGDRLLFAGTVQTVSQNYEGLPDQVAYDVTAVDFTFLLKKYLPFGRYENISASTLVKALISKYAPDFTTTKVQTGLAKVTVEFNGTKDLPTCLSEIAKAIGGGHWYCDYERDIHFFHITPKNVTLPSLPDTNIKIDFGSSMVVSEGSSIPASFSFQAGWYRFVISCVYNNGVESKLGPWSNWVYLDGNHQINFSSIPTFAAVGTATPETRRIYMNRLLPFYTLNRSGINKTSSMKIIERFFQLDHDNVTTSLSLWYGQGWSGTDGSGQPQGASVSSLVNIPGTTKLPKVAFSGHPAAPTAAPTGVLVPDSGPSNRGMYYFFSYFKVAFQYADGSISYAGPSSGLIRYDAPYPNYGTLVRYADLSNIPIGPTVDGVPCIARLVYQNRGNTLVESWINGNGWVLGVFILPNNTATTMRLNPEAQLDYVYAGDTRYIAHGAYLDETTTPYYPQATQNTPVLEPDPIPVWPNPDGPWLEDDSRPDDINDTNTTLLRPDAGPPIRLSRDLSQIRNRIFVFGRGTQLTQACTIGDTTLYVGDANAFSVNGGRIYMKGEVYVYSRVDVQTINAYFIELVEPVRVAAAQGESLCNYMQLDDFDSQAALAKIELLKNGNLSDGVHEGIVQDGTLKTIFQLFMRGNAELELFGRPIDTIEYATTDPKTRSGKMVTVSLTNPPIEGEFLIQNVTIDRIHDDADDAPPRYTVRASSVKYDLQDLLLQMVNGNSNIGQGSSVIGVAASAVVDASADVDTTLLWNTVNKRNYVAMGHGYNNSLPVNGPYWPFGGMTGSPGSFGYDYGADGPWQYMETTGSGNTRDLALIASGPGRVMFANAPQLDVVMKTGPYIQGTRMWIVLKDQSGFPSSDTDFVNCYIGLRFSTSAFDTGWRPVVSRPNPGGAQTVGPNLGQVKPSTIYHLRIGLDQSGVPYYYAREWNGTIYTHTFPSSVMFGSLSTRNANVNFSISQLDATGSLRQYWHKTALFQWGATYNMDF